MAKEPVLSKVERDRQVFKEFGVSAASIWSLSGEEEEQERQLQGMQGIDTWNNMRRGDHTGAAIVAGLTLPIRRSSWTVTPSSEKDADKQAAEFLEQCMDDMSHSWDAMIIDALTFFPFGWSYLEQVMKRRQGQTPPGKDAAKSKYTDGRVGWRKIVLRPQTSLLQWLIDDNGGIQGISQNVPNRTPADIPIQRSLLFRTTTEGNYPEGVSIFRPAWRPWRQRQRLEMVEGMAYTRNLAGILKVSLGAGATTEAEESQESDEYKAKKLIRDAYNDRMVGVIETDALKVGVLEGPKGTDFEPLGKCITRKDHEMARATLAHFIILALQERGSYALAKDESDLFLMAVTAYLEAMSDVIQRFAVERLFRLNVFPGIAELPQVDATAVYKPDLKEVSEAINNLVGAQLLTVDDTLEAYIRELAGFPELPVDLTRASREEEEQEEPEPSTSAGVEQPKDVEKGLETEEEHEGHAEPFSRRHSPTARRYLEATDRYSTSLTGTYQDWAGDTSVFEGLGPETTEEELWAKLDDYLLVGLLLMKEKGYEDLLAAYILGFGSPSIGPEGLRLVEDALSKNDHYLAGSLFEDIRGKLDGEMAAILLLLKYGDVDGAMDLIETTVLSLDYRPPLYAGTYWEMIHAGVGMRLTDRGTIEGPPVRRRLDPLAIHCSTCPLKAKEYASWEAMVSEAGVPGDGSDECDGRCRCGVQVLHEGIWIWA